MRQWLSFFKGMRLVVALIGGLAYSSISADGSQVVIVAHPALAIDVINETELARIYLLRQTFWPDGLPIIALNREANSSTRELFTSQVLKQTAAALASHWQQMHFKGKTPPLVQESDQAVLMFVQKVPGAIGYVSSNTPVGDNVKILAKLP
jgi:ABC-type phosphate transport system substrate-binding protein